ncbi:LuxR C-terminal-related transcriptional regulator [Actinomycetospora endophytica]|uniref:LuxR C-terminal-related transcriptional regulator n=1 Tax=Actinomycetospora endophytica TaxID=2291215 RepID=A0ABS8P953_9PSEU|nr:LuxR family transcriptional regulator [Actinomycetospora endophytica]MCD2194785.1 LuxR C-terminal-related transcriptional regulator [Actinomycetospora endophytica]
MAEAWPFTARDGELTAALAALDEQGTVVIGGPAGVGKSRLAREITAREDPEQMIGVVRATASAQEIPLGAFADVVPGVDPGRASPDLAHVREAVAALGSPEGDRLLVVDDAHRLDAVSATVVHQLATGKQARLVLTVRTGDPAPDAVTALWKDGSAARLELAPFDQEQTDAVLAAVLGTDLEAGTAARLHDTARGNVLWLRHLVDGERAAGRLHLEDGSWAWHGAVTLSPALDDLVASRIGTLTGEQRRVLELLSVSEPLGLGMIEELAGAAAVEEVSQRGLVSVEPDGGRWEVRLGHPLYGESVRARTSVPRARRLRSELSAALARTGGRRVGDGLRRAVLDLGSDRPLDPSVLLTAAMQASGLGDFTLAERLLRAAVGAGGGFEARAGLSHLLVYLMRDDEADAMLAEAVAAASTPTEYARAVTVRTMLVHFGAQVGGDGSEVLAEAERRAAPTTSTPQGSAPEDSTPPELREFDGMRAAIAICRERVDEAIERGERVLVEGTGSDQALVLATWALCMARAFSGRGAVEGSVVDRGIEAARRNPETVAMQSNIGYSQIVDADLRGRADLARDRLTWVHGLTGPQAAVLVALYEGRMARSAGRVRAALRAFAGALPTFPGAGGGYGSWLAAMVTQCHGMLGDARAARVALDDAEARRHPRIPLLDVELELARAWTAAASGNQRTAIETCRRAAARCRQTGVLAFEIVLRHTAVRFGDREQATRLAELDRQLGTARARLAAAHAAALAAPDPERLLAVAEELEDAGLGLEAADAAGQSATTARAASRTVVAARAEELAQRLAVACEDARTPALRDAGAPVPLSAREREVAVLAGEGLTNRQIAERLHVSVRTVESHVYRACARLGLSDRAALVVVAGGRKQ